MNRRLRLKAEYQKDRDTSSWSLGEAVVIRIWEALWYLILRWTPKRLNFLRLTMLRLFGAKVHGHAFVYASARIYAPFNLELFEGSCIGPRANIYNLGKVMLRERSVISQETMICGGSHDLSTRRMPLLIGDVEIGADVFVGARALILPGVTVGEGAVVGAGAVVAKDVAPWTVVAGNPARVVGKREIR